MTLKKIGLLAAIAGAFVTSSPAASITPYRRVLRDSDGRALNRRRHGPFVLMADGTASRPPHSSPFVVAVCRRADGTGRVYHRCRTRDQAAAHKPYLIEHVNGWGQVTRRERLSAGAHDAR